MSSIANDLQQQSQQESTGFVSGPLQSAPDSRATKPHGSKLQQAQEETSEKAAVPAAASAPDPAISKSTAHQLADSASQQGKAAVDKACLALIACVQRCVLWLCNFSVMYCFSVPCGAKYAKAAQVPPGLSVRQAIFIMLHVLAALPPSTGP